MSRETNESILKYCYLWKSHFKSLTKSNLFPENSSGNYKWQIHLRPSDNGEFFIFKLKYIAIGNFNVTPATQFSEINCSVQYNCSVNFYCCLTGLQHAAKFSVNKGKEHEPIKFARSDFNQLADIRIELTIETVCSKSATKKGITKSNVLTGQNPLDLSSLYLNSKYSDVEIHVDKTCMKAHRLVLGNRSPVFSAMFEHCCLEKSTGSIIISDFKVDVVRLFLRYCYSGSVPIPNEETAKHLFRIADKYAVEGLKEQSGQFLSQNINVNNCMDLILLADTYEALDLKRSAMNFFFSQTKPMTEWKNFKNIVENRPSLLIELLKQQ